MIRLLDIEFYKLSNSRYFKVLFVLFIIFVIAVPVVINLFMDSLSHDTQMTNEGKVIIQQISIFYFKDIWQNLTYIYKFGTILLSFITIISITSEYSYKTSKQNIIDGLSRREFILSKIYMIFVFAIFVTILVGIVGGVTGYLWSSVRDWDSALLNIHFLGFYFIYIIAFLLFSLVIGLIVKKSGVAISIMIFYTVLIEPIITAISTYGLKIEWLSSFYPINGINKLIPDPISKYIVKNSQTHEFILPVIVTLVYILFYLFISNTLIKRRDL